ESSAVVVATSFPASSRTVIVAPGTASCPLSAKVVYTFSDSGPVTCGAGGVVGSGGSGLGELVGSGLVVGAPDSGDELGVSAGGAGCWLGSDCWLGSAGGAAGTAERSGSAGVAGAWGCCVPGW